MIKTSGVSRILLIWKMVFIKQFPKYELQRYNNHLIIE